MTMVRSVVTTIGVILSVIGTAAFFISGYGYQWGWWELSFAFRVLLLWGGLAALAGLIASAIGFLPGGSSSPHLIWIWTGVILGAVTFGSMMYWYLESSKYPPIHDITTDVQDPPEFDAIVPLRDDAPNPTEYGGAEVAAIQKEHYPDIQPLVLESPYNEAFEQVLEAVHSTSWELVASNSREGRIEATHTLPWFGFKDDVVIRIDTSEIDSSYTRIDVRSVSRLGRGDIGVNASRIRNFLDRLQDE